MQDSEARQFLFEVAADYLQLAEFVERMAFTKPSGDGG